MKSVQYGIFLTKSDLIKSTKKETVYPYYQNDNGSLTIAYFYGNPEYSLCSDGDISLFSFNQKEVNAIKAKHPELTNNIFDLSIIKKFHLTVAYQKQGNFTFIHIRDKYDNMLGTIVGNLKTNGFEFTTLDGFDDCLGDGNNFKRVEFSDDDFITINYEIQHILNTKITSRFNDNLAWYHFINAHPKQTEGKRFPVSLFVKLINA